ncbi:MAG TPA: flagellar basal body P-ring formation chaperone FlgA [Limnobacter sp.]|nr:flagellar basal body P-ring formation chaperone FlgA [Limnobacter sp.]
MKFNKLFSKIGFIANTWPTSYSRKAFGFLVLSAAAVQCLPAYASKWVTQDQLPDLVDTTSLPAGANVQVNFLKQDPRIGGSECPAALFSNSENNRMWGRTFVRVQCVGAGTTPFFVGVDVKVWAPVLVVKNTLQSGQAVQANDVEFRTMDLTQLNHGWVTELSHLSHKTAARQLWPGTMLKYEHLKGQPIVRHGDTVKVMVKGPGFAIGGTATAMEAAEQGQIVKIKTAQGKILHGVAAGDLLVEVSL